MLLLQILGIPFIALLLISAIFVIGSTGVNQPGYPRENEQPDVISDEPDLAIKAIPPNLPRQGCNL